MEFYFTSTGLGQLYGKTIYTINFRRMFAVKVHDNDDCRVYRR